MKIVCFCSMAYESDEQISQCPACGEATCVSSLTFRDTAEMACDLAEILAEHEPKEAL